MTYDLKLNAKFNRNRLITLGDEIVHMAPVVVSSVIALGEKDA